MRALVLSLALWLMPHSSTAEDIVLGLSDDEVAISATFEGKEILLFGAIRRDGRADLEGDLGVIVTIAGPDEELIIRRKDKRFGIWVNVESIEVGIAPSFYAIATNRPLEEILLDSEDVGTRISLERAIRSVGPAESSVQDFMEALIRIREKNSKYQYLPDGVRVDEETLFRTSISLPAALTEGRYKAEIYLTRGGKIVDLYTTHIPVEKVGMERWLYRMANDQPVIYGLMSLAIAIFAGWAASAVFRFVRT